MRNRDGPSSVWTRAWTIFPEAGFHRESFPCGSAGTRLGDESDMECENAADRLTIVDCLAPIPFF